MTLRAACLPREMFFIKVLTSMVISYCANTGKSCVTGDVHMQLDYVKQNSCLDNFCLPNMLPIRLMEPRIRDPPEDLSVQFPPSSSRLPHLLPP
jgi:hypothetical protein